MLPLPSKNMSTFQIKGKEANNVKIDMWEAINTHHNQFRFFSWPILNQSHSTNLTKNAKRVNHTFCVIWGHWIPFHKSEIQKMDSFFYKSRASPQLNGAPIFYSKSIPRDLISNMGGRESLWKLVFLIIFADMSYPHPHYIIMLLHDQV